MKYQARFPEDLWQVNRDNQIDYSKRVVYGYGVLEKSNIVIAGITRNSSRALYYNLLRIQALSEFTKIQTIIYTNDNEDDTLAILRGNIAQELNINVIEETLGKKHHGPVTTTDRYRDMAYYRNKYMEQADQIDYNFLVVIDLDTHGFSYDGFAHAIGCMDKADFIGSNGVIYQGADKFGIRRLYYDSLAFRRIGSTGPHPSEEINLLNYNRGDPLVRVQSCFGGLGIYTPKVKGMRYTEKDCDHVTINNKLKCYLDPSLIVLYSDNYYEH